MNEIEQLREEVDQLRAELEKLNEVVAENASATGRCLASIGKAVMYLASKTGAVKHDKG